MGGVDTQQPMVVLVLGVLARAGPLLRADQSEGVVGLDVGSVLHDRGEAVDVLERALGGVGAQRARVVQVVDGNMILKAGLGNHRLHGLQQQLHPHFYSNPSDDAIHTYCVGIEANHVDWHLSKGVCDVLDTHMITSWLVALMAIFVVLHS